MVWDQLSSVINFLSWIEYIEGGVSPCDLSVLTGGSKNAVTRDVSRRIVRGVVQKRGAIPITLLIANYASHILFPLTTRARIYATISVVRISSFDHFFEKPNFSFSFSLGNPSISRSPWQHALGTSRSFILAARLASTHRILSVP